MIVTIDNDLTITIKDTNCFAIAKAISRFDNYYDANGLIEFSVTELPNNVWTIDTIWTYGEPVPSTATLQEQFEDWLTPAAH